MIKAQHDQIGQMLLPLLPAPSDAITTTDGEVHGVMYRIYTPNGSSKLEPLPVGIWTHGGG